jgi:hypothetical protein
MKDKDENLEEFEEELEEDINFDEDELEDLEDEDEEDREISDFDFKFINQSKHKQDGKHSLERDVLFLGKKDEEKEDEQDSTMFFNDEVQVETGSQFEFESKNHEEYVNNIKLEKDIYEILTDNTDIDFTQPRRKPRREDFNLYYELVLKNLKHKYTKCEIFVSLSYYFTDNIFNMYKLLDRKHATSIILELKSKGFLDNLGKINFV